MSTSAAAPAAAAEPASAPRLLLPAGLLAHLRARVPQIDGAEAWAVGGAWLTGVPGSPPLLPPGRAASVARALAEWIAICSPSSHLAALDGAALLSERAAYTGWQRRGAVTLGGAGRLLPLGAGPSGDAGEAFAAVSCARVDDPLLYGAAFGIEIAADDPWPELARAVAGVDAPTLRRVALELSLPCWPVEAPPQRASAARGEKFAEAFAEPVAGEHRPRDLSGARVVDFSSLWAGPLCANLLGLAGAEVIKVESVLRPDGARRGERDFYRMLHAGHRAVSFDPRDPASLAAIDSLVATADIVIEASRPRALARLGIDATRHVAGGATWVSITAAGRASERIGFGDDVAASAGLVAHPHAERPDAAPWFVGDAIADPLTGLLAAAICMTETVSAGSRTGELWDLSMRDIVRFTFAFDEVLTAEGRPLPGTPLPSAVQPRRRPGDEAGLPHGTPEPSGPPELGADNPELLGLPVPEPDSAERHG